MDYRYYGCVIALLFTAVAWLAIYRAIEWLRG
jgi:hypothetical protein